MREAMSIAEFARFTRMPTDEVERLIDLRLLDPNRDGSLDDVDVVRAESCRTRSRTG